MDKRRIWATVLALAAIGCGDSGAGGAGAGGAGSGGGDGGGGGGPPACDPGLLCLDVEPEGPATGRLAVIWWRFDEGGVITDPSVALQQPFDASATSVEVALSGIAEAPDYALFCERDCADPMTCPCTSLFQAGVALVMVVSDFDGDGSIGVADLAEPGTIVGIANTAVVSGSATFAITPPPFGDVFPKGLNEGIAAYRIHEDGAYEPSPGGTRFTLKVGPDVF
jgi:hypothetical protein